MKNLILITILILTFITGDSYSQSYFGKSLFKDRIQANNVLYVTSLAQGTNEHATIASALSAYQTGMLIILAPEYFDEDVTISIDNVHIQGLNKELSKIKSLTVTGSDFRMNNLSVLNNTTFISQEAWDWFSNGIIINDVDFYGALNIGTTSIVLQEAIRMYNCAELGNDKNIIINCYNGNNIFYDFRVQHSSAPISNGIYIYGGRVDFEGGTGIFLDSLVYKTPSVYSQISFKHIYAMNIYNLVTANSTAFHVLAFDYCRFDFGEYQVAGNITIDGRFELDIFNSSPYIYKNIVFNSIANSRFVGMQQRGWQSTSQISGTGLSYLRIYNSSLSGTAPVGLGGNSGNVWSAFMDD